MKTKFLFLGLFAILLLSACSQTMDASFTKTQAWKLESKSTYDPDLFNNLGDTLEGFGLELDSLDESAINMAMSSLESYCNRLGVRMDWRRSQSLSGEVTISFVLNGTRLDQLNQLSQGAITVMEEAPGQFHLVSQSFDLSQYTGGLPLDMFGAASLEFRLHTGGIISSNAQKVSGNTAIWYNPVGMDVTFNAGGGSLGWLGPVLGVLGGAVLLFGLIGLLANRKKTCFACGARIPARAKVCTQCGTELVFRMDDNGY